MIETLAYRPIRNKQELKSTGNTAVGCVVVVVNRLGQVLTVREKEKGGLNVLTETRKEEEYVWDNVIGALIEEGGVDTDDFDRFGYVRGESYVGRVGFDKKGGQALADVVVVTYDGDGKSFHPRNEVDVVGFRGIDKLINDPGLRIAVRPALELVRDSGVLDGIWMKKEQDPIFNGGTAEQYYGSRILLNDLALS
jgi:hypothetical protein